jgi:hypothetical protein
MPLLRCLQHVQAQQHSQYKPRECNASERHFTRVNVSSKHIGHSEHHSEQRESPHLVCAHCAQNLRIGTNLDDARVLQCPICSPGIWGFHAQLPAPQRRNVILQSQRGQLRSVTSARQVRICRDAPCHVRQGPCSAHTDVSGWWPLPWNGHAVHS